MYKLDPSIISKNANLFDYENSDDSAQCVMHWYSVLFDTIPSVNTIGFRGIKTNRDEAIEYVTNYLTSQGFELFMRYEDSKYRNTAVEPDEISRYGNKFIEEYSTIVSFINTERKIIISYRTNPTIDCIYDVKDSSALAFTDQFIQDFCDNCVMHKSVKSTIKYICERGNGFDTERMDINSPENFDIATLYNDDFAPVNDNIRKFLTEDRSGLVILHGEQGTGKTTYLRHLITSINKSFVYLPMDMAGSLSKPSLLTFIKTELKDSVIIIEDCEQLLQDRGNNPYSMNTGLSNILNIADGLLGDSLQLKFICTFNNDVRKIDKALLRKGRLIDKYEFGKLSEDKTAALIKKLYNRDDIHKPMTLAEIFNMDSENHGVQKERDRIGF